MKIQKKRKRTESISCKMQHMAKESKSKKKKCDRTAQIQQVIQSSVEATEKLRGIMIVARKLNSEEL